MCEANVYIIKDGQESLLMESVDRIIPGDDQSLFLENVFGERKIIKAAIVEMELVRHRVLVKEIEVPATLPSQKELWLEPATNHGHFHAGEQVLIKIFKGYNMRPLDRMDLSGLEAFTIQEGQEKNQPIERKDGDWLIDLGQESDGLIQLYVKENLPQEQLYGKMIVEIGHHHHSLQPLGLPLEIMPSNYSHARMGQYYEVQVLKNGVPWSGAVISVTYTSTRSSHYPHRLISDDAGRAKVFLTAQGNYLFIVRHENICSTFTLVKSF